MSDPNSKPEIRLIIRDYPPGHPIELKIGQQQRENRLSTLVWKILDRLKGKATPYDEPNP